MGKLYIDYRHRNGVNYRPDGSKFTGAVYLGRVEAYGMLEWKDVRKFQGTGKLLC